MEDIFKANESMLKSMLLDEERLITYVSLSKDLCVHVNNSKFLLLRVVDIIRQERPDLQLNVNYIISGALDDDNARTIICPEKDLDDEKMRFKNIFFEHIYSVCKGRPNIDTAAYVSVSKFEDLALCAGLIKNNLCNKWTSMEIGNLKSNSQVAAPEKSMSLPLNKIKQETNFFKNGYTKELSKQKDNETKSEPIIKKEIISPKKDSINGTHTIDNLQKPNGHKSQKGIAGFFNKMSNSKNTNESKVKVMDGTKAIIEPEKNDIKEEKIEVEEEDKTEKQDIIKKDSTNRNLNQIKKNAKVDKKRKRVLHVSDSDSDNENNDPFIDNSLTEQEEPNTYESDDEIPPTPTTNNISIRSGIVNPKKRRKVIDKTYTDEDGYVLTKKEEIYESCSDNEEEIKVQEKSPPKKQVKIEISPKAKTVGSKKKVSPPQKGKQSTLTNFFKKI